MYSVVSSQYPAGYLPAGPFDLFQAPVYLIGNFDIGAPAEDDSVAHHGHPIAPQHRSVFPVHSAVPTSGSGRSGSRFFFKTRLLNSSGVTSRYLVRTVTRYLRLQYFRKAVLYSHAATRFAHRGRHIISRQLLRVDPHPHGVARTPRYGFR